MLRGSYGAGVRMTIWPIEIADLDAVAVRVPVGSVPGRTWSAASEAIFSFPDVAAASPRSVIPAGGVTSPFDAEPKSAISIDPGSWA